MAYVRTRADMLVNERRMRSWLSGQRQGGKRSTGATLKAWLSGTGACDGFRVQLAGRRTEPYGRGAGYRPKSSKRTFSSSTPQTVIWVYCPLIRLIPCP